MTAVIEKLVTLGAFSMSALVANFSKRGSTLPAARCLLSSWMNTIICSAACRFAIRLLAPSPVAINQ